MLSKPIPRIECPTPKAFVKEYVARNRPVVIAGAKGHEPALQRWSLEYMAERCGDTKIPVFHYASAFFRPDPGHEPTVEMMTMREFLDRSVTTPPHLYLGNLPLGLFPRLCSDFTPPDIFGRPPMIQVSFINWEGSITPLHFDVCEGLVVQVSGAKRVVLFPPGTKKIYPFPLFSNLAHFSQVDIDDPDMDRFPRFDPGDAWEATIQPGEMLYIPYCWWHQLYPKDELNITNGFFWFAGVAKALKNPGQSFRRGVMLPHDAEFRVARQRFRAN